MNAIEITYRISEKIISEFNKSSKVHKVDNLVQQRISFFTGSETNEGVVEFSLCFNYTIGENEEPPYWRADDDAKKKIDEKVMPCIRGMRKLIIDIVEQFIDCEKFEFKLEEPTKFGMVWSSVSVKGKRAKR